MNYEKKTGSDLRQEILLHELTGEQITQPSDIVSRVLKAHSSENLGNIPQDNPRHEEPKTQPISVDDATVDSEPTSKRKTCR